MQLVVQVLHPSYQVYEAMKEQVFYGFESYLARQKVRPQVEDSFWTAVQVLEGGDIGQITILAQDPDYFNPEPF